ncbi:MAG: hypothetical protein HY525_20230 [Betaproteobacteria bacterium]|nr:hypothetical protein [Betaproteobacteria bacterium]
MEDAESFINRFESQLESAVKFHVGRHPAVQSDFRFRWSVIKRIDLNACRTYAASRLPVDEAERATFAFIDFKLQIIALLLFDWDYFNEHILSLSPRDSASVPAGSQEYQRFLLYSYHHAEASKVRVVVERLMNVIYFIEKRQMLEGVESKKSAFERFLAEYPLWSFMAPVLTLTKELDDRFRTPEVHKGSMMRKRIFGEGQDQWSLTGVSTKLIEVLNIVIPGLQQVFRQASANNGLQPTAGSGG